jgi:hypothetical protein
MYPIVNPLNHPKIIDLSMNAINHLFSNIASITGYAKGGNKYYQANNQNDIGLMFDTLPLFHN